MKNQVATGEPFNVTHRRMARIDELVACGRARESLSIDKPSLLRRVVDNLRYFVAITKGRA